MNPLKIIYAGTPEFAVPALQALLDSRHDVVAVYTQPDRPAGRGKKLRMSPVKTLALEYDVPVYQPLNFKNEADQRALIDLQADVMVVAAYGLILPKVILDAPRFGCINIHASLLPRWRGAAPIQRALEAGDKTTGVTLMQMAEGLDTGDMLKKVSTPIAMSDTAQDVHDRLADMGGSTLLNLLDDVQSGTLKPQVQDDSLASYAHKLNRQDARIDWSQSAFEIQRKIHAFNPWPTAWTTITSATIKGKNLKLLLAEAKPTDEAVTQQVGHVIAESAAGIEVSTGAGVLVIKRLQIEGKKALSAAEFLRGNSLAGLVFEQGGA